MVEYDKFVGDITPALQLYATLQVPATFSNDGAVQLCLNPNNCTMYPNAFKYSDVRTL
jgi:hypothetical protein